jgi:hypothetical protein
MFASGLKEAQLSVIPLQYITNPNVLASLLEYLVESKNRSSLLTCYVVY